ncbi:hypothetical protein M0R45_000327 [Rubus argutus]|uniref:Uncharacterized protein n=1 Tax=Rubus argutus TaxID=59490 RepID=A0AAW1VL07_RUBAR
MGSTKSPRLNCLPALFYQNGLAGSWRYPGRITSRQLGWLDRRSPAVGSYGLGILILTCDGHGGWLVDVSQGWLWQCDEVVLACWWWWRSNDDLGYGKWREGISLGCGLETRDWWWLWVSGRQG